MKAFLVLRKVPSSKMWILDSYKDFTYDRQLATARMAVQTMEDTYGVSFRIVEVDIPEAMNDAIPLADAIEALATDPEGAKST